MTAADFPLQVEWVPALNALAVRYYHHGEARRLLLSDWLTFRRRQAQRRAMNAKGGAR